MTIMEDTFMLIREEHPDLDAEIRSILMARAQTGATIGQIKEDYRKTTGITFPVFDNVTDFLLCIPGVMVFCNERGTRIFNVRPTEKTKHIYNMVINQKPASERASSSSENNYNNYNRFKNYRQSTMATRDNGKNYARFGGSNWQPPAPWRSHLYRPITNYQIYTDQQHPQAFFDQQQQNQQLSKNFENSDGAAKKRKASYHDNCEYLYNRIYNGYDQNILQTNTFQTTANFDSNLNNIDNNSEQLNNEVIEIVDDDIADSHESAIFANPTAAIEDEVFKRPTGRAVRAIHTTSRTQHEPNNNFDPNGQKFIADFNNFHINSNNNNNDSAMEIVDENLMNERERPSSIIVNPQAPIENAFFKRPAEPRPVRAMHTSSPSRSTRRSSQTTDSLFSYDLDCEARLLDFPLLGDDFFLYLARMELRCKFKRYERVLQSGLCVSGQTIKAAIKRISRLPYNNYANRRIIVNIGSVDIMQGKPLVQIEHDYRNLINAINRRGMQPILTTLAPLANYAHNDAVKSTIVRFNEFIKREGRCLLVIDIWALFVNEKKQTFFDCYQNEPRQVTGAKESYVFWNKIGRQRVLQLIESKLEY